MKGVSTMSIRTNKYPVIDIIKVRHILVSVFSKDLLEVIVEGILRLNPGAMFYSTGGTGGKIAEILGTGASKNYMSIEDFTGAPEMEGGLVKTLHPKIHAGLLSERGNPLHEKYLYEEMAKFGKGPGVYFDMLIGNLYPFGAVISEEGSTSEDARVNIDIGGPTMAMAAAKNWHSVAVVAHAYSYTEVISFLEKNGGATTAEERFNLTKVALREIGDYRSEIGKYFGGLDYERDVHPHIKMAM